MVEIYTTPSCRSCIKAVKWLKNHHIPYIEKNLFMSIVQKEELQKILENTPAGFDTIISVRSTAYKSLNVNFDSLSIEQACNIISTNPSIIKRPIIIDAEHNNMQVGYNKTDIEIFQLAADHDWKKCSLTKDACHDKVIKKAIHKNHE